MQIRDEVLFIMFIVVGVVLGIYLGVDHRYEYAVDEDSPCIEDYHRLYLTGLARLQLSTAEREKKTLEREKRAFHDLPLDIQIDELNGENSLYSCELPPLEIVNGEVQVYPLPVAPGCVTTNKLHIDIGLSKATQQSISADAKSVGELTMSYADGSNAEMWGSGFAVRGNDNNPYLITTCHTIAPLVDTQSDSKKLKSDVDLSVSFDNSSITCSVKKDIVCSNTSGLDIALLAMDCMKNPPTLTLSDKYDQHRISFVADESGEPRFGLIGYADLEHPLDAKSILLYKDAIPSNAPKTAQFFVFDRIDRAYSCKEGPKIFMEQAATTVGLSGGPVIDLSDATVVGVHTCCSSYFDFPKSKPPQAQLSCAQLHRTMLNQAVSAGSILQDENLCPLLSDSPKNCSNSTAGLQ